MRLTISNVINLWFGADTPIRQYKIKLNPEIWTACQQVSKDFKAPSGILLPERYRKSDKVSFAKVVLDMLEKNPNALSSSTKHRAYLMV